MKVAPLYVECPVCEAEPRACCATGDGGLYHPAHAHPERVALAQERAPQIWAAFALEISHA